MTTMLVIDTRDRQLAVSTANVTRSEAGLVVRFALEVAPLRLLLKGRTWRNPLNTGMPVLVLGTGYQAQSSAGFVHVENAWAHLGQPVVGVCEMQRPLRLVRPEVATLFRPGRLMTQATFTNSNFNTTDAAYAGVRLLAEVAPQGVTLAEGQSDKVSVFRLLPEQSTSRLELFDLAEVEEEHRPERFTLEAVVRAALPRNPYLGEQLISLIERWDSPLVPAGWRAFGHDQRRLMIETVNRIKAEESTSAEPAAVRESDPAQAGEPLEEWERELLAPPRGDVA